MGLFFLLRPLRYPTLALLVGAALCTPVSGAIRKGQVEGGDSSQRMQTAEVIPAPATEPDSTSSTDPDVAPAWSLLGQWALQHPVKEGALNLKEDGTFAGPEGDAGRWTLSTQQGRVLLVLIWKDQTTESAEMIDGDHFHGRLPNGTFDLRRPSDRARRTSKADRNAPVQVTSAMYGKGDNRVDVTPELRKLVKNGRLNIAAPWDFGSLDPEAGESEDLIVQYRVGKQNRTARFRKDEPIVLPKE